MKVELSDIKFKNREKLFFPGADITKGEVITYYDRISNFLSLFLRNRPLAEAPVATPLEWDELDNRELTSRFIPLKNIFEHLNHFEDPWRKFNINQTDLANSIETFKRLPGKKYNH